MTLVDDELGIIRPKRMDIEEMKKEQTIFVMEVSQRIRVHNHFQVVFTFLR